MVLLVFLLLTVVVTHAAATTCRSDAECVENLLPGSQCRGGFCSNPFRHGGCLAQLAAARASDSLSSDSTDSSNEKEYVRTSKRVCTSIDDTNGEQSNNNDDPACIAPDPELDYTEVRILAQNWASSALQTWILQIILSEMLGVPTSVETGRLEGSLDFYAQDLPLVYGEAYDWDAMRRADQHVDCRNVVQEQTGTVETAQQRSSPPYTSCAHVTPEIWSGPLESVEELERAGVLRPRHSMGALGSLSWFTPRYVGESDPTLLNFLGLMGDENREKLAETFRRPTTLGEYCEEVSANGCVTPDGVADRAPVNEKEAALYFLDGVYTGHFRATDKNNCTVNPTTCTGHVVDFPCGWTSNLLQLTHHLDIALESNGPGTKGGYAYEQMVDIWSAANATKSPVIMQWWTPEPLYQTFLGSDAAFMKVALPSPTQTCVDAHVGAEVRCEGSLEEQVGSPLGACGYPPNPLSRAMTSSLYALSHGRDIPHAKQSPAYDTIKSLLLTQLQIGDMFTSWLDKEHHNDGFSGRLAACKWVSENLDLVETLIPSSFPRIVQTDNTVFSDVFIVSLVCASLACITVVIMIVLTFRQRKKRTVMRAQVEFMYLLLVGLFCVAVGAALLVAPPSQITCTLSVWMINFGYTLELVPLIVKMAAINRIMVAAARMRRVVLKLSKLFFTVSALMTLVVGVLLTWTIIDPPRKFVDFDVTERLSDTGCTIVSTTSFCSSDSDWWSYTALSWQALLLVFATVLAFQTRKIPEDMNESQVLAVMIYSHFVLVVMRGVLFSMRGVLDATKLPFYTSFVHSLDTVATCGIYFFPKFYADDIPILPADISGNLRASIRAFPSMIRPPGERISSSTFQGQWGTTVSLYGKTAQSTESSSGEPRRKKDEVEDSTETTTLGFSNRNLVTAVSTGSKSGHDDRKPRHQPRDDDIDETDKCILESPSSSPLPSTSEDQNEVSYQPFLRVPENTEPDEDIDTEYFL